MASFPFFRDFRVNRKALIKCVNTLSLVQELGMLCAEVSSTLSGQGIWEEVAHENRRVRAVVYSASASDCHARLFVLLLLLAGSRDVSSMCKENKPTCLRPFSPRNCISLGFDRTWSAAPA